MRVPRILLCLRCTPAMPVRLRRFQRRYQRPAHSQHFYSSFPLCPHPFCGYPPNMNATSVTDSRIREDVLRDPRYPVHRIADQLRPYLLTLVEQFHPEKVVLFGSYAYGDPTKDSDVDLLVVKPIISSRVKDKIAIRRAWWPIMRGASPLSFDLLLTTPEEFKSDRWARGAFHTEIKNHGLLVLA